MLWRLIYLIWDKFRNLIACINFFFISRKHILSINYYNSSSSCICEHHIKGRFQHHLISIKVDFTWTAIILLWFSLLHKHLFCVILSQFLWMFFFYLRELIDIVYQNDCVSKVLIPRNLFPYKQNKEVWAIAI